MAFLVVKYETGEVAMVKRLVLATLLCAFAATTVADGRNGASHACDNESVLNNSPR